MRIAVRVRRRSALRFAWVSSVLLAAGLGWGVARYDLSEPAPVRRDTPAVAAPAPLQRDGVEDRLSAESRPAELQATPEPEPEPPPIASAAPAAPSTGEAPVPPKKKKRPPEPPPPEAQAEVAPEPPPVAVEPVPAEPAPPVSTGVLARAREADRLAEGRDAAGAKREATALLAEHASYSGLAAALVADGASESQAQLAALRVLQVAGEESTSRDVARELKRSWSGTPAVAESIHHWGILNPRILAVEPSIADEHQLVVNGTLENPDVTQVRRVRIAVEALDAGGNLLGTLETRVRPSVLAPGAQGQFSVVFKKLDPASVLRTRASLLEWESEVGAPTEREPAAHPADAD